MLFLTEHIHQFTTQQTTSISLAIHYDNDFIIIIIIPIINVPTYYTVRLQLRVQ